jgi:steroid delta-isomerase-like uncharacterized protein
MPVDSGLRERREAVVRRHVEAENRHDAAATAATFHSPRYEVVPFGAVSDGSQAVQDLLSGLFTGFPDFKVEVRRTLHADEAVVAEIVMTGTHRAEWAGIPATGRKFELASACFFDFDGDRLTCEKVYFDFATLLRQLGVMP